MQACEVAEQTSRLLVEFKYVSLDYPVRSSC
jgi:hypothetical protein